MTSLEPLVAEPDPQIEVECYIAARRRYGELKGGPEGKALIENLAGWGYRFPGLSIALAICLLSLGGIPPTLGFQAKYMVFVEAIKGGNLWLALIGIASSLVGVFYYLRVVYVLYMKPETSEPTMTIDLGTRLAAALAAGGVLLVGMFPSGLLGAIERFVFG